MPCARVLQEAREVLGLVNPWEVKKSANADPYECLTYDNVGQLAYLHAFVSEVGENHVRKWHARTDAQCVGTHMKIPALAGPFKRHIAHSAYST